jgi:hypothetical protein
MGTHKSNWKIGMPCQSHTTNGGSAGGIFDAGADDDELVACRALLVEGLLGRAGWSSKPSLTIFLARFGAGHESAT